MPEIKFDIVADVSKLESQLKALGIADGRLVVAAGGGKGGGGGEAAASGGGAAGALGFLKLLGPIAVGIGVVAAFFDAVGPLIKLAMKLLSAVILILLMPFLQLFIPILKSGIPLLIGIAQTISNGIQSLFEAFHLPDAIEKLAAGDFLGFLEELITIDDVFNFGAWLFTEITKNLTLTNLLLLGQWIWTTLTGILGFAWEVLSGIGAWMFEAIIATVSTTFEVLLGLGKWLWDNYTGLLMIGFSVLLGFGKWLWDTITGVFADLPDKIGQAIGGIAQKVKEGANFFLELLFGGINGIIGFLKGIAIPSPFGTIKPFGFLSTLEVPKLETGGYVAQTGLALVHKGESVIPAKANGGSVTMNVTNNFSGMGNREEVKRLIEQSNNQLLARIRQMTSTGGRLHVG